MSDYPDELESIGILSKAARDITVVGNTDGIKEDLTLISNAAREMLKTSKGIVEVAETDPYHALGFIGLPMMGCYWKGYQRALEDLGGRMPELRQ